MKRSRWFLVRLAISLRVELRHVSVGASLIRLAPLQNVLVDLKLKDFAGY